MATAPPPTAAAGANHPPPSTATTNTAATLHPHLYPRLPASNNTIVRPPLDVYKKLAIVRQEDDEVVYQNADGSWGKVGDLGLTRQRRRGSSDGGEGGEGDGGGGSEGEAKDGQKTEEEEEEEEVSCIPKD